MAQRVTHSLVKALQAVPELASLDDAVLLEIVGASVNLFWPSGSVVFRRGEPSDGLYIVLSGRVSVSDDDNEIAQIGPGDYFGENALLLRTTRSRTIVAAEDTEALVLPRDSFQELIESLPAVAEQVRLKHEARLSTRAGA